MALIFGLYGSNFWHYSTFSDSDYLLFGLYHRMILCSHSVQILWFHEFGFVICWRWGLFWRSDVALIFDPWIKFFGLAGPCFWTHIIFIRTTFYGCFTFLAGYSLKNFGVLWFKSSRCFSDFWSQSVSFNGSSTCSWWPPSPGDYDWFEELDLIFSASLIVLWSQRPSF